MDNKTRVRWEARAKIIKAMAHPSRLFIVDELSKKPKCVRELTQKIGADMSTVSRHLAILRNVGIVHDEKHGCQVYYKLVCPCVLNFFSCVESVIKTAVKERLDLVESRSFGKS